MSHTSIQSRCFRKYEYLDSAFPLLYSMMEVLLLYDFDRFVSVL